MTTAPSLRRSRVGAAAVLLLLLVVTLAGPRAPARAQGRATTQSGPLEVVLTSITPGQVPRTGPITLTGRVTNTSTEDWRDVNVSAFVSTSPMTTSSELAQAAAEPYAANVGDRLTSAHAFIGIGDLGPGDETTFTLRVPRDEIPIPDQPGVYWIGAHALGTNDDGRDDTADGRARTFIPLVARGTAKVPVSLVLPFRAEVRRDADLRLRDPDAWTSALADTGRLERLLSLAQDARSEPFTLLVDPAVLDAVDTVARGPVLDLPKPTDPSSTPSAGAEPDAGSRTADPPDEGAEAARAAAWLSRFTQVASRVRVLGLGYADPDVTALARRAPGLITTADTEANTVFARFGITAGRAAAPVDGKISTKALAVLDPSTTVLVDPDAVTLDPSAADTTLARSAEGQVLALTDAGAAAGGPGPTPATDALAMRQRILSEAALRSVAGHTSPLIVSLPDAWGPGPDWRSAAFVRGLARPWTDLQQLGATDGTAGAPAAAPVYPASARKAQLEVRQVDAARRVARVGRVYAAALTEPGNLVESFRRLALEGTSMHARGDLSSVREADEEVGAVDDRLAGIRVVGSPFVTMSGGSGSFVVTLVNDLSRPVRVGLSATTSSPALRITAPRTPVVLAAGQRTTVRVRASSQETGVRSVVLGAVTSDGAAVGTPARFTVRSSKVSSLVWGVLAGAALLLVVTIVRRWVKRGLRRDPATSGPPRPVRD